MATKAKPKQKPANYSLSTPKFSKPILIIFALIFASIGGYAIYRSFAAGPTINIGETNILINGDQNNANLLVAQSATLSQTATIQSMSFYVTAAAGNLRMGLYDATGPNGGPGALKAQTAEITPVVGWNTTNVTSPVSLNAGTYWLAYLANNNNLAFLKAEDFSSSGAYYYYTYGALPSAFSISPTTTTSHWSFYATLNTALESNALPGDTNGDGQVNLTDLTNLLANWGTNNAPCDFNGDGIANGVDLSILLSHYGSTVTQPPPPTLNTTLTFINLQGSFMSTFPTSRGGQYSFLIEANPDAQISEVPNVVALGKSLGIPVFAYYDLEDLVNCCNVGDGVLSSTALSSGWVVTHNGQPMNEAPQYPNEYVANIGDSNYLNAWINNVINQVKSLGLSGIWMDNVLENGAHYYGGYYPDQYLTQQSWADAYVSALSTIHQRFKAAGLSVGGNVIAYGDNNFVNGVSDKAWADRVLPYLDYAGKESFMYDGIGDVYGMDNDPTGVTAYMNMQRDYEAAGVGFMPGVNTVPDYGIGNPPSSTEQRLRYAGGAYKINWNGITRGGLSIQGDQVLSAQYSNTDLNFDFNIGTPVGAIGGIQVNGAYERQYTQGWVLWNPTGSSKTINVSGGPYKNQAGQTGISGNVTVPAYDSVFLQQ